jgi:hypothetical protein
VAARGGQTGAANGNGYSVGRLTTSWIQVDRQITGENSTNGHAPPTDLQVHIASFAAEIR